MVKKQWVENDDKKDKIDVIENGNNGGVWAKRVL